MGQPPEWCEGDSLTSPGGLWTPNIGQAPDWPGGSGSFSWRILEGGVLPKYCLSPAECSRFLKLAQRAGCPPPREIEALFLKQGGSYPSSDPFRCSECGPRQSIRSTHNSKISFGFANDPFPTLLASAVNPFAFYFEDDPLGGCVRYPSEIESERMMGLAGGLDEVWRGRRRNSSSPTI